MGKESALWYFESVDLYDVLCPHKVKVMADKHTFHNFRKDEFIYFPDEPATHIYMIAEGRVRIGRYLDDGKEVIDRQLRGQGKDRARLGLIPVSDPFAWRRACCPTSSPSGMARWMRSGSFA